MPADLTPFGKSVAEALPPFLADNPTIQSVLDTLSRELSRFEDTADLVRYLAFPDHADERYNILSLWETFLDLPINPSNVPLTRRQAAVTAQLRKRNSGAGYDWEAAISEAIGEAGWSYVENPTPYHVTLTFSYPQSAFQAKRVEHLVRQITPAHIELGFVYTTGFILNQSLLSVDRL